MRKKVFLIGTLLVLICTTLGIGALTNTLAGKKQNPYWFTRKNRDYFSQWADEVEDLVDQTTAATYLYLSVTTAPDPNLEGQFYYDAGTNTIKLCTAVGTWTSLSTAGGVSLDGAYDIGESITVDSGTAVTLTTSAASDSAALAIVHGETGAYPAFSISNAGTDPTIEITTSGAGADITGANWSMAKTGALTCVGITNTGSITSSAADVLFDDTYDVQWDTSHDILHFLDNAVLGFGGTVSDANADMTFKGDATNVLVEVKTQDGADLIFGATNALDILIWNDAADSNVKFDNSAELLSLDGWDILMQDGDFLKFGDGSDWTVTSATALKLLWTPSTTDGTSSFDIGANTAGADFQLFGADTTGAYCLWDSDKDALWLDKADIALGQTDYILFGDTMGTGDLSLGTSADTILSFAQVVAGTGTIYFGADGVNDLDVTFFGDTASSYMKWDADAATNGALLFDAASIALGDGDNILFGDTLGTGHFSIGESSNVLVIKQVTAGAGTIAFGVDGANDLDVTFFGDTASSFMKWDADERTNGGLIFDAADITLGDADVLVFGDSDDFTMTATDTAFTWQGLQTDETETIALGADGDGIDLALYGATSSATSRFNASIDTFTFTNIDVKLDDATVLFFGTKTDMTTADGDFKVAWVSDTRLDFTAVVANSDIFIGDGTIATDFHIDNITTAGADVRWVQADDTAAGSWYFGIDGKGIDTYWYGEAVNKLVKWDMSADDWMFGANGEEVDVWFYGGETGDFIQFDGDLDTYGSLVFEDVTLNMMDDTAINLGNSKDVVIDWDTTNEYAEIKGPVQYGETTLCLFDRIPMFSTWQPAATGFTWGGAATGATGDENVMMFRDATFIYNILGAGQTELGPQMRAGGFDISMDDADNEGVEICGAEPLVGGGKDNFIVGTAFYLKVKIYLTNISGTDDLWIGFRNVGAFTGDIDTYNTIAAIGLNANAGDFYTHTELDAGTHTETDVTSVAEGDWGDAEAFVLEVYVAANGAVTYKINGVIPTGVAGFTWTASDVVVPFVFLIHANADQANLTYIQRWECGYE